MYVIESSTSKKCSISIDTVSEEDLARINKKRFFFDWKKEQKEGILFKLSIPDVKEIIGLISIEFYDTEERVHIRLLAVSIENVGKNKAYDRIAGNLIVHAAILAIRKYGSNAAISLRPKTELGQYYMDQYGFEQAGISLFMEGKRLLMLLKKYINE